MLAAYAAFERTVGDVVAAGRIEIDSSNYYFPNTIWNSGPVYGDAPDSTLAEVSKLGLSEYYEGAGGSGTMALKAAHPTPVGDTTQLMQASVSTVFGGSAVASENDWGKSDVQGSAYSWGRYELDSGTRPTGDLSYNAEIRIESLTPLPGKMGDGEVG